jgi:glycosyltransferase involved in cell wall biosynthesis
MTTSTPPVLSVVIPAFNYGRYLGECLESILNQVEAPPFEVVIVNDGSTDDTVEVLERYADPRIHVVHQENRGHVAAINRALPLTRGAIIARIDPDDRYRPHFMRTVCDRFTANPDVVLVYGNAALIDDAGTDTGAVSYRPHRGGFVGSDFLALLERNFICAPTVAARREAWLDVLPVPDGLAFHDWYFTVLMARRHPFCFVDDVIADYRVHADNHHTKISKDRSEERSLLYLLDRVFHETEPDPAAERAKQAVRRRIYAAHYVDVAEKYFGFGMTRDARRCYLQALRLRPASLIHRGIGRRFMATLAGRRFYDRLKANRRKPGDTIPAAEGAPSPARRLY